MPGKSIFPGYLIREHQSNATCRGWTGVTPPPQGRKGAKISQELFASGLLALAFLDFVIFENSLGIYAGLQTQNLALFLQFEMIYRLRISIIQLRRNAKLL